MNRAYVSGLFCLIFVLVLGTGAQAEVSFEITPGAGYLTGYSSFEFGNMPTEADYQTPQRAPYFPITEHKFPLMSGLATLEAKAVLGPITLEGGVKKNFTHDSGKARTYDWGKPYYDPNPDPAHTGGNGDPGWFIYHTDWASSAGTYTTYDLDIETRSRTDLDALMWNAKASCRLYTYSYNYYDRDWLTGEVSHRDGEFSVNLGIGYEKRSFDFETELLKQWSPSGHDDEYLMNGDGSVTENYTVHYSIPYIELGVEQRTGNLAMDMSFGFSSLVHIDDMEESLIQVPGPLYGTGNLSGTALMFSTHLNYSITPRWFVGLAADYIKVRADGTQNQFAFPSLLIHEADGGPHGIIVPGYDLSLKEKVDSQQSCFTFNVGFKFGK